MSDEDEDESCDDDEDNDDSLAGHIEEAKRYGNKPLMPVGIVRSAWVKAGGDGELFTNMLHNAIMGVTTETGQALLLEGLAEESKANGRGALANPELDLGVLTLWLQSAMLALGRILTKDKIQGGPPFLLGGFTVALIQNYVSEHVPELDEETMSYDNKALGEAMCVSCWAITNMLMQCYATAVAAQASNTNKGVDDIGPARMRGSVDDFPGGFMPEWMKRLASERAMSVVAGQS